MASSCTDDSPRAGSVETDTAGSGRGVRSSPTLQSNDEDIDYLQVDANGEVNFDLIEKMAVEHGWGLDLQNLKNPAARARTEGTHDDLSKSVGDDAKVDIADYGVGSHRRTASSGSRSRGRSKSTATSDIKARPMLKGMVSKKFSVSTVR